MSDIKYPRLFVLDADGKTPVPVRNVIEWGLTLDPENDLHRQLAYDKVGTTEVSTVFIGIDYSFGRDRKPRCWETMVFGGENDRWCQRYNSHDDALAGHKRALRYVSRGLPIP